ncbi:hypothetical protein E2C01_003558 [Portunus trituberculatus]|uniref:Uncharacterized protein n=1 Tax=Portunus trituberculatus TaxID=210409 RepID=A0A5B7CQG4_PORTR|nr:hypothetical protein [Portunus trituberculatus]
MPDTENMESLKANGAVVICTGRNKKGDKRVLGKECGVGKESDVSEECVALEKDVDELNEIRKKNVRQGKRMGRQHIRMRCRMRCI